jgi:hypothetical protein
MSATHILSLPGRFLRLLISTVGPWNDYLLFAVASLFAIGVLVAIGIANYRASLDNRSVAARGNRFLRLTFGTVLVLWILAVASTGIATTLAVCARYTADAALAALTGAAFGTLTARFVWSLLGPQFAIMEAVFGAGVFVLISIAYSLPVYKQPILAALDHIGIASVKLPVAELTFAERPARRPVQNTGSQAGTPNGGIPRPSDPMPGLTFLDQDVSDEDDVERADAGFLEKDKHYIEFFSDVKGDDEQYAFTIIDHAKMLLQPMHRLARCLKTYVKVVPDARLLSFDLRPLLLQVFKIEAGNFAAAREQHLINAVSWEDWKRLNVQIVQVMQKVNANFEFLQQVKDDCDSQDIRKTFPENEPISEYLPPWQPYVSIALSSLLMAHGSTDEGIDVLAKWLDLWKCTRDGGEGCEFHTQINPRRLPAWFGYRAEFQMNILLNQWIGANNIVYLDFLHDHAMRFKQFALTHGEGVNIQDALARCLKESGQESNWFTKITDAARKSREEWRVRVVQLLLDEENDTLLAERNFLFESDIPDLENLYARAKTLARFSAECIEPREKKVEERERWENVAASYRVTAGLFGLAAADRMGRLADSGYDRRRAIDIRQESTKDLREGYRNLKDAREKHQRDLDKKLLSKRVFLPFEQEDAYWSAGQAVERLNVGEP